MALCLNCYVPGCDSVSCRDSISNYPNPFRRPALAWDRMVISYHRDTGRWQKAVITVALRVLLFDIGFIVGKWLF